MRKRIRRWLARPAFEGLPEELLQFPRWHLLGGRAFIGWRGEMSWFQLDVYGLSVVIWKKDWRMTQWGQEQQPQRATRQRS